MQIRKLANADGYLVSDQGDIYSLWTLGCKAHIGIIPHRLKPSAIGRGYRGVMIRSNRGVVSRQYIHRLVCFTFHGSPKPGNEVRHLNGRKDDNRSANLAWGTISENVEDNRRLGVYRKGEDSALAKLTTADVLKIRSLKSGSLSQTEIARRFNISRSVVQSVMARTTWNHV